jgi:CubicO group peptidase (beta-lactamase class C family)
MVPRKLILVLAASAAAVAGPAASQDNRHNHRALAAGYMASFLCSGIFSAGRTEEQVRKDEIVKGNVVPEVQAALNTLTPEIDRQARLVRVRFDDAMPPRVAAWRPHLGCSQLPIGAAPEAVNMLPRVTAQPPANMDGKPWPMGDQKAFAAPRGNRKALDAAITSAFSRSGNDIHTIGVVVVQNGKIVAERYRDDYGIHVPLRTWSAAKSVASTLVGVGVHQGKMDVKAPAPIPEWRTPGDPRAKITTDQMLRMASGLWTPNNLSDPVYFGGYSVAEQTAAAPLEYAPGTVFRYSNTDTMLATRGLQAVLGDGQASIDFPFTQLYWKIGMMHTFAETDWRGHFVSSSQIWTTARDLARFGLLYLNDGVWQGERILPVGWRDYVRANGPAQPSSGPVYGGAFWTFSPTAGVPSDSFYANGGRGNYVVIVPSRNVVIVRRGLDTPTGFNIVGFTKEVLAALN